jgi:hypothetical protein
MVRCKPIFLVLASLMISGVASAARMEVPDNDYGGIGVGGGTCYNAGVPCDLMSQTYTESNGNFQVFAFEINTNVPGFVLTLSSTDGGSFFVPSGPNQFSYGSVYCPDGHHPQVTALCWTGTGNVGADTTMLDSLDPHVSDPVTSVSFVIPGSAQGLVFYGLAALQGTQLPGLSTGSQGPFTTINIQAAIAIPEPGSLSLLACALIAGAAFKKRSSL